MKKVIIILSLALLSLTTWAYDFQVDQLCYNIISENNVEVTWQQAPDHPNNIPAYPSLSEALTIPSTVIYNGITYTVTRIGYSAFADCTSLTSVTLPNSIKIIGEYAFSSCSSLTFVTIPNSITSIESGAFIFCSSLTTVTIPENVTSIGESAFSSCTSLTSVNLPNSITSIGDYAFSSCTSLTSVTLPNSIASIGSGAFFESSSLTTIYTETQTPPTLGSDCFYATNLNVIFVPSGTSSAYASAWGNDYLYIESGSEIKLTVYVATSGGLATAIAEKGYTLDQVNKLTVVGSLNDTDFGIIKNNMTSLIELNLEGIDNTTLPYEAFKNKNRLLNIVLPADLTIVPNNAFEGCSSLTSVIIPNSVTSIEVWAFGYCRSLTSITIPNSVTSIGEFAFESCSSLASVAIPNSVTSIGSFAFENCLSLSFITIPNTVTYIGNGAFSGCSSLTSITIPNNVTNIGSEVFRQCSSLSSATIGSGVESMDSYIFYDCSFLDTITCLGGNPPVMSEDFATINPSTCKLYVPQYALVDYLHAPVWSSFVNMYGIDVDYTLSIQMNEGGKIIYNNQEYIANTELTIDGGSQVTLQLVANTYNTIGYFRVNGVDYTSDIQGDGTITLPAVKQDANIEIFFAQSYLITFKDDDGTILQTSMVGY